MHNELLCGTQDWQHADWNTDYYPEECPVEWRFAYYSNDFRSLWLPGSFWQRPLSDQAIALSQFSEDGDEGFHFIVELPHNWVNTADTVLGQLNDASAQIACLVLPIIDSPDIWLPSAKRLSKHHALSLNISKNHIHYITSKIIAEQHGWSIVWQAGEGKPVTCGQFLATVTSQTNLREIRQSIDLISQWMGSERSGGLFFSPTNSAPQMALQSRTVSELMGVA